MEGFPAAARCTDNPQPDLLGSFPADVCPEIGHRAKFGHSVAEGGGGVDRIIGVA